jgi:glycosyltransferase involved in cell wall biosynthesis
MKIAQVCPPFLSVPPKKYGAVERVVSYLTEELIQQGHDVTLFASGDSITRARLIAPCEKACGDVPDKMLVFATMMAMVAREALNYDIIHFHFIDWFFLPFVKQVATPSVITFHMPIQPCAPLQDLFRECADVPIVSISNAQRPMGLHVNWSRTVHHGIPSDIYHLTDQSAGYFAFLGLLAPRKGPDLAIDIAMAAQIPLRIAGPIRNRMEQEYFDSVLAPKLRDSGATYVGELDDLAKCAFLGGAIALLFPIRWREPFGLVMIEAMACGTPVIAFDCGSVGEIISNDINGFVVSGVPAAVQAVADIGRIERKRCRLEFERRFTASEMCRAYLGVYESLSAGGLT